MDTPTIDQIRKRAFELWEHAGRCLWGRGPFHREEKSEMDAPTAGFEEVRRTIGEYADDLREILKKLRKKLN